MIAVTNAMLPLLRRSPAPRIVNVSSHAASLTITSDPDGPLAALLPSAAYAPSKTALIALTVQYANELRKDGILINAAAPGYVDTDSNNHTGFLTVAQGAAVLVRLATLGADRPTGGSSARRARCPGDGGLDRSRRTGTVRRIVHVIGLDQFDDVSQASPGLLALVTRSPATLLGRVTSDLMQADRAPAGRGSGSRCAPGGLCRPARPPCRPCSLRCPGKQRNTWRITIAGLLLAFRSLHSPYDSWYDI